MNAYDAHMNFKKIWFSTFDVGKVRQKIIVIEHNNEKKSAAQPTK